MMPYFHKTVMDEYTKRKLKVLIHLAMVDGKFHSAEKALISEFVRDKGFEVDEFQLMKMSKENINDVGEIDDKGEMLFLALKLVKADNVIMESELTFCREIALKLKFNPEVIDQLVNKNLSREQFDMEIKKWKTI